jgi:hypothetical protein
VWSATPLQLKEVKHINCWVATQQQDTILGKQMKGQIKRESEKCAKNK